MLPFVLHEKSILTNVYKHVYTISKAQVIFYKSIMKTKKDLDYAQQKILNFVKHDKTAILFNSVQPSTIYSIFTPVPMQCIALISMVGLFHYYLLSNKVSSFGIIQKHPITIYTFKESQRSLTNNSKVMLLKFCKIHSCYINKMFLKNVSY